MNDFKIIKEKNKKKIIKSFLPIEGFCIKPKWNNHQNLIAVKMMVLVNEEIKTLMIHKQFDRMFRRLIKMTIDVTESENATSSDCAIALNEVTKTMSILEKKYQKEMKKKDYMLLQKKILLLEAKLKEKLLQIRNNEKLLKQVYYQNQKTEEKGKSR